MENQPQLGKHMSRPYTHTFISLLTNCSGYIAVDRKFRARFRVNLIVMFVNERLSCLLTEAQCHSAGLYETVTVVTHVYITFIVY